MKKLIVLLLLIIIVSITITVNASSNPLTNICLNGEVGEGCVYTIYLNQILHTVGLEYPFSFPCQGYDCPPLDIIK